MRQLLLAPVVWAFLFSSAGADPLVFIGKVVDAETGMPVAVTIRPGVQLNIEQPRATSAIDKVESTDGTFRIEAAGKDFLFGREESLRFLRFEADGYAAAVSESRMPTDGLVELTIKLKKSPAIRGTVIGTDGKPAAHARVVLGTDVLNANAEVFMPTSVNPPDRKTYDVWSATSADGTFALPAQDVDRVELVAIDDAGIGYAVAGKPGEATKIELKPFGRIEGRVTFDGKAVAGAEGQVQAIDNRDGPDARRFISQSARVRLGDDGSVPLTRVPPGYVKMYFVAPGVETYLDVTAIDLKPGGSISIVGADGKATLEGSVRLPGSGEVTYFVRLMRYADPVELPENWNDLQVRDTWWNGPALTPEMQAHMKQWQSGATLQKGVTVRPDGTFTLAGLGDGFWSVAIDATWDDEASKLSMRGTRTFHFSVTDGKPNVQRIEPLPLKSSTTDTSALIRPGDAMPAIDGTYDDGRKFDWADLKGKVVFVEIWGPWCGPCKASMPAVKRLSDRFKGRDDFAVISFSVDDDPKRPAAYKAEHGFDWPDVYLGTHETGRPKARALGVQGYPTYYLVDREGKLIHETFVGAAIGQIDAALQRQP